MPTTPAGNATAKSRWPSRGEIPRILASVASDAELLEAWRGGDADAGEALFERYFRPIMPDIGITLGSIANVLQAQKRYTEALDDHHRALAIATAKFGRNHSAVAIDLQNLAGTLRLMGRLDDAAKHLLDAREIWQEVHGGKHPAAADAEFNLGAVYCDQGKLDDALRCHERALEMRRAGLEEGHASIGASLHAVGQIQLRRGDGEAAAVALREAVSIRSNAQDDDGAASSRALLREATGR